MYQVEANPQMASYYRQRMAKRQAGTVTGQQATVAAPNSGYRGRDPPRVLQNPNRRDDRRPSTRGGRGRDSRRGVSFGNRSGGVYVTTHITNEPPEVQGNQEDAGPTWATDKDSDDSASSEN